MQNLSFIPPSQAVKPVEESAKSNLVTGKNSQNSSQNPDDSGAQNSFQNLLNKQVLAKRTQENSAAKVTNKTAVKSDNTQKNQQVDAAGKEDDSLGSVHRANIEDLVAKLKEHHLSDEDVTLVDEMSDGDEDAEMLNAVEDTVNQLQPQGSIDLAMLRAHLQPINTAGGTQKLEDQPLTEEVLSKELSTSSLENALFQNRTQSLQGDKVTGDADRWKSTLSEKTSALKVEQDVFSKDIDQEVMAAPVDGKNAPALDSLAKLLDSEKVKDAFAKEGFGKEIIKDAASLNALQSQSSPQPMINQSTQAASQLGSSNQIMAYPGRTGWNQEVSQKVVWMVGAGEQSATLTLNPPDLGPLQVVISVNNNQADASFFSDNPEVRQALEDGLEHLRESMQSSGLQLGQANVNAGQQQSQQTFQEMAQKQFANNLKSQQGLMDKELPTMGITVRESQGLVDTFA